MGYSSKMLPNPVEEVKIPDFLDKGKAGFPD